MEMMCTDGCQKFLIGNNMGYYIGIGILIVVIAFFMGATQKARGYNFWRYFIVSIFIVAGIYFMLENLVLKPK